MILFIFFCPNGKPAFFKTKVRFINLLIYMCMCHQEVLPPDFCFCCPEPQWHQQLSEGGLEEAWPRAAGPAARPAAIFLTPLPSTSSASSPVLPYLFSSLATVLWRGTAFSPQLARCQAESTEPEVRRGWYQTIAISWGSQTIRSICGCAFVTETIPLRFLSSSPLQAVTQKTQHWMLAKATVW